MGFPGGSNDKESACNAGDRDQTQVSCNAGDLGLISGSGRSPGEGKGYALQCSCLESSMDRKACWATVCGVAKSQND